MTVENGKFYFIKSENLTKKVIQTSVEVIILASKGVSIPFYNIIEMKEILLLNM